MSSKRTKALEWNFSEISDANIPRTMGYTEWVKPMVITITKRTFLGSFRRVYAKHHLYQINVPGVHKLHSHTRSTKTSGITTLVWRASKG